jgi:uncharacterized protein (DUF58 family)
MPPLSGRVALNRIATMVDRPPAATLNDGLPGSQTALPRYAQVVLIGDFLSPVGEARAALSRIAAAGVHGHVLQVLDPAEEDLPFDGRVRFEGMESDDTVLISRVEAVREEYAGRLERHRAGLRNLMRGLGWSFATHRTDRPPHSALLALYNALADQRGK